MRPKGPHDQGPKGEGKGEGNWPQPPDYLLPPRPAKCPPNQTRLKWQRTVQRRRLGRYQVTPADRHWQITPRHSRQTLASRSTKSQANGNSRMTTATRWSGTWRRIPGYPSCVPGSLLYRLSCTDQCLTSTLQIDEELVKQQQAVYRIDGVDEDVCSISFPTILPVLILNAKSLFPTRHQPHPSKHEQKSAK